MTCFHNVYGLIKTRNDVKSSDNEYLIGRNYSKLSIVCGHCVIPKISKLTTPLISRSPRGSTRFDGLFGFWTVESPSRRAKLPDQWTWIRTIEGVDPLNPPSPLNIRPCFWFLIAAMKFIWVEKPRRAPRGVGQRAVKVNWTHGRNEMENTAKTTGYRWNSSGFEWNWGWGPALEWLAIAGDRLRMT